MGTINNLYSKHLELEELKGQYSSLKSAMREANSKKELRTIKSEMQSIRTRITILQCELKNGYSLQH